MTINLNLGWEKQKKIKNTTTSKILSCLSIELHLTEDNLGVKMLSSKRDLQVTGTFRIAYQHWF